MDRRSFINLSALTGLLSPTLFISGCKSTDHNIHKSALAGGVYHTKESPGRWNSPGKINSHLPTLALDSATKKIVVTTNHGMKSYDHYIIKHILLDKNFKYLDDTVFTMGKDSKPISKYDTTSGKLKGYSGTLYALSMCNLHDTWMNEINI